MGTFLENRKVHFNYEIQDKIEAGIELFGFEVKSIRGNQGSLDGAYVTLVGSEAYLTGATIPPYQSGNTPITYDPIRNRRLLLSKKEINDLRDVKERKGLTAVPMSLYSKGPKIKVSIGLGKGKKKFDKRETIKKRETDRNVRRIAKDR